MSYKTILVHCGASNSVGQRLAVADLAQRFGARLVGLHVRRPFEMSVFYEGGLVMDDILRSYEDGAKTDEAAASISDDVVARCLLSEAIRLFKAADRSNDDIAAELTAAADNLDDDTPLVFMRP